jgi:lipid-binding SYLF domain-containing protein
MDMKRRNAMISSVGLGLVALAATGCTTTTGGGGDPVARRQSLNSAADDALSRLYAQAGGSRELVSSARGVLVFPSVVTAGFMVGGSLGDGVMRKGGKTTGFFRMTEASVGLLAGAQSQAIFLLFMTDASLQRFEASNGWTVGADGSVALLTVGADARVTTRTAQQEIVGFVLTNAGLMGNLSLSGNRIAPLNI